MDGILIVIFFIMGLLFGSFLNVVGLRVPQKTFFASNRSACPSCGKTLNWFELIPVVSYLIQGGKCRHCKQPISKLYPFVELYTGIAFSLCYVWTGIQFELMVACILVSLSSIIFVTDFKYMIIPDKIILTFLPLFILIRIISPLEPWWSSVSGGIVGFVLIAAIIFISNGGMGAGDMKLLGLLGVLLGFPMILLTFFIATIYGLIISLIIMLFRHFSLQQAIPFGPAIVLAGVTVYIFGDRIVNWYWGYFISL